MIISDATTQLVWDTPWHPKAFPHLRAELRCLMEYSSLVDSSQRALTIFEDKQPVHLAPHQPSTYKPFIPSITLAAVCTTVSAKGTAFQVVPHPDLEIFQSFLITESKSWNFLVNNTAEALSSEGNSSSLSFSQEQSGNNCRPCQWCPCPKMNQMEVKEKKHSLQHRL